MVNYRVSRGGEVLTILDSYKVRKRDFKRELADIREREGELPIFMRSGFSLRMEWTVHNFLHSLGIAKDRTKDVDFDLPPDKPEWVYKIIGGVVWVFVR